MNDAMAYTLDFDQISLKDVPRVGGKNASLGELYNSLRPKGIAVPDGFAITADSYRELLGVGGLNEKLRTILSGFDWRDVDELVTAGHSARAAIMATPIPVALTSAIALAYDRLSSRLGGQTELAVRSSATAEDLPEASFAGQQESYLNVRGRDALLHAVHSCFASLFTDRAITYRAERGYDHLQVALSVGVQPMVRSDRGSSGVIFTLDPETGFRDVIVINGSYGLGEFIVQGVVTPDEWMVFKPTLSGERRPLIGRRLGSKEVRLVYAGGNRATRSESIAPAERARFCLSDDEVLKLARWSRSIEDHYSEVAGHQQPMDIEWAKDGLSGELFILQARPETVHSAKPRTAAAEIYQLAQAPGPPLLKGQAVGEKISSGPVRVVRDVSGLVEVGWGDVLVAEKTDPDWEPVMKRVAAIVTDQGGRTAHAAIVSRELGLPCIVGATDATLVLKDGEDVTVSCAEGSEGHVYGGRIPFKVDRIIASVIPQTRTKIMLNAGDPGKALSLTAIPNAGVGLARIEFIITNHIGIHPMALVRFPKLKDVYAVTEIGSRIREEEPREFFVRRLAEGIGRIAAAFYPKPTIVRTSDFKTNEYAQLLGGREFEPVEENPMIGFRGASRYYDPRYAEGFAMECAAILRVRRDMGLTNVRIMIPFCRTVQEARQVIDAMSANNLQQGVDGLEIYAMCELPANVVLADEFLEIFDGYSIGSNDLTQLVLGVDRDSRTVARLFDERDGAVLRMIAQVIEAAKRKGKPIGICGQAPSDYPEFAAWLVEQGIGSMSLNPDTAIKTTLAVSAAEAQSLKAGASKGGGIG
jgi:pyruvate,water dikinase